MKAIQCMWNCQTWVATVLKDYDICWPLVSFGFFDPFLIPRSTSMFERNSTTMWLVKTHLCIGPSDDEKPLTPPETEIRLLL